MPSRRKTPPSPKEPTADSLRRTALAYLERFPSSAAQVRLILHRRIIRYCRLTTDAHPDSYISMIDPLIDSLRSAGYIDDMAYAKGLYTSLSRKGLPARMALQKMRAKGLSTDLIETLCSHAKEDAGNQSLSRTDTEARLEEGDDDFSRALRFARRKRLGPFAPQTGGKPPDKAMATMARAGFDYETVTAVMKMAHALVEEEEEEAPWNFSSL